MKNWILFLTFSFIFFSCNQSLKNPKEKANIKLNFINVNETDFNIKSFKPISKKLINNSRNYLIDKIVPSSKYKYWECVYKIGGLDSTNIYFKKRGNIIVYQGDSLNYSFLAKKTDSNKGFFVECMPIVCFSYIIAIKENQGLDIIDTDKKLKKFIGNVDNLEEMILLSKLNNFWFDTTNILGGSYKEMPSHYLLYLLEYNSCPETYSSVKAVLTKRGKFITLNKNIYKKTEDCTIE